MGRKKNNHKPVIVTITGTPKLGYYLDAIIREEGKGNSRGEVARNFVWDAINKLIRDGNIDRKAGLFEGEDGE